jgi:hypothetical protein
MSLETEIKALTGAMTRLAEGVEKLLGAQGKDSTPAPKAETKQEVAAQAPALQQTADVAQVTHSAAALTLEDIKKALMATAAKFDAVTGTAKSKAILQRFGAAKLSQVHEDAYGQFIELCEIVAAGGEV